MSISISAAQRRVLAIADDERRLRRLAVRLGLSLGLLLVASAAYYTYDRYLVRVESPLDRATHGLEDQVRATPNDPLLRLQVAQAYVQQGRQEQAVSQYEEALKLRANWQPALLGMAAAELARNNTQRAETIYRQIADLNKDNELRYANVDLQEVYYRLALFASRDGRHQEAVQWAREALAVDRTQADALLLLGTSEEALGHTSAAADAYRQAVRFDPNFREGFLALERVDGVLGDQPEARYAHAMGLLAGGDPDRSLQELQGVVRDSPEYAEAYQGLGLVYARQGQREAAVQAFRTALDHNPDLLLADWSLRSLGADR
jgi:tetratricopeptide (TPR) repeat protein